MPQVNCPQCQQSLKVSEAALGKMIVCPRCQGQVWLPAVIPATVPAGPPPLPAVPPLPAPASLPLLAPAAYPEHDDRGGRGSLPGHACGNPLDAHPELGAFVREFVGVPLTKAQKIWFFIVLGLSVLFLLLLLYSWVRGHRDTIILWSLLGSVTSLIATVLALRAYLIGRRIPSRLLVCENGFLYEERDAIPCLWTEVVELADVIMGVGAWLSKIPHVRKSNGAEIHFDKQIHGIKEFADILVRAVVPRLAAEAVTALRQGRLVEFPPHITLHPDGLKFPAALFLWDDISKISLISYCPPRPGVTVAFGLIGAVLYAAANTKPVLMVNFQGKRQPEFIPQAEISNLPVLVNLLRDEFQVPIIRTK